MSSIAGDAIEWNSTATRHKTCFAGYDFSPKLNYTRLAGCNSPSGATEPAERVSCSIDVGLQPMSSIAGDAIEWNSTATRHKTCFAGYDFSPKLNYTRLAGCSSLSGELNPQSGFPAR